ncbi:MAG TPA: alpha/beta fold hydrolase [Burkholderiaceae bacterium]
MVQALTRQLLVFQLAAVLGVAAASHFLLHLGWGAALGIGLLVLAAVRMGISINNFILAWQYHSETPSEYRLNALLFLRMFCVEFLASMWTTSWAMPFKGFADAPIAKTNRLPVLLIHGYGCNSGYWHRLRRPLDESGAVYRAIDLEPVFGDIEAYVPMIAQAVEALRSDSGQDKLIVVAHSMGGLAARAYLRQEGSERIARVITLGSPHHGTGIANFGAGMNCRQMHWRGNARTGSPSIWLRHLDESEDEATRKLFVSIYSHQDNIVAPQTSSELQGARNIAFRGIGHVALALHPVIHTCVLAEIRAAWAAYQAKPAPDHAEREMTGS